MDTNAGSKYTNAFFVSFGFLLLTFSTSLYYLSITIYVEFFLKNRGNSVPSFLAIYYYYLVAVAIPLLIPSSIAFAPASGVTFPDVTSFKLSAAGVQTAAISGMFGIG